MRAGPIPVAEITGVADIAARLAGAGARQALAAQRLRLQRQALKDRERAEAAERARRAREETAAAIAAVDAQVFQILDPEKLAREPRRIIARTAAAFGVSREDILGRCRKHRSLRARRAALAAVKAAHPGRSLLWLGRVFQRDHTTILHALRRMEALGVPQPPQHAPGEG